MASDVSQKILQREVLRSKTSSTSHRRLYSSRTFVDELDIVNELDGHSGCVNALSWSKSGRLLASGSDDRHLNIHAYQPDDSTKQFQLQTTVATGHTQNIFSVKFMPHSGDNTVVTCAGDGDVRVFDLEYAGPATSASNASSMASSSRRRGRNNVFSGAKYMSDGDTNARVYRSHADRVKRVVTEDSPYLFLTCSEDGEVRQWDTRQPSSYYPRPRGDVYVPPPLISYRRFNVDLNTISCSGSQPYYIALGGSHIHCFLHDRRMAGRSRAEESGRPTQAPRNGTGIDDDIMNEATRCVRRFAPHGEEKERRNGRGHITACKISDARPNELIVSWSQDHIYSFDMIREPDAATASNSSTMSASTKLKRKRPVNASSETSLQKPSIKHAATSDSTPASYKSALRIRYENGQQEDIPIQDHDDDASPTEPQRTARRTTEAILHICKTMFDYAERDVDQTRRFTKSLGRAAAILSDIDEVIRLWSYPLDPSSNEVAAQKRLKQLREQARRFVQAAGSLSRVLGGRLQTVSGDSPLLVQFHRVEIRSSDQVVPQKEQFGYDFIKAILLWLESGPGMLIEGFTRSNKVDVNSRAALRLPVPDDDATIESIEEYLKPYLLRLADTINVMNLDSNPYEQEEHRRAYESAEAATQDFFEKVNIPFKDLLSDEYLTYEGQALDRKEMVQHWAYTVARGLLHQCILPIDFAELDIAFGGTGRLPASLCREAATLLDQSVSDKEITDLEIVSEEDALSPQTSHTPSAHEDTSMFVAEETEHDDDPDHDVGMHSSDQDIDQDMGEGYDDDDDDEDDDDDDSSEPDEVDGVPYTGRVLQTSKQRERERARNTLGSGVPCVGSIQTYKGHCNVRTVKDVNYYGLDDEYVVSGSDDGNFFIWDSKTGKLLNILEGDGEIVNVIQGHPYEPMLAVSGIDHTIKIFSPDHRARTAARLGQEVSAHDPSSFSSLAWPYRPSRGRASAAANDEDAGTDDSAVAAAAQDDGDDAYVAPHGLRSRQRMNMHSAITAMNLENMRQGDSESLLTSSYLRLVARHLRSQRATQGGSTPTNLNLPGVNVEEDDDGRVRIVLGDDCVVM